MRNKKVGSRLLPLLLAVVVILQFTASSAETPADPASPPETVRAYAFAKASPLTAYESGDLTNGRRENFEFGVPLEVTERTSDYVKIRRPDGKSMYLRLSHVLVVPFPSWVVSTSAYRQSDRSRIRFWESSAKLSDFLAGTGTLHSKWDYEEYFGESGAPNFEIRLPVFATDTLELLGGSRQVTICGVLMPITRTMAEDFDKVSSGTNFQLILSILADTSWSTNEYLERVVSEMVKGINRRELQDRIVKINTISFGLGESEKASDLGSTSLADLEGRKWHSDTANKATDGDVEPLVDGLFLLSDKIEESSAEAEGKPLVLILSGSDVETSGHVAKLGKTVSLSDLTLPDATTAILAQVTPEPGKSLEDASKMLPVKLARYLKFSETVGDEIGAELKNVVEEMKKEEIPQSAFVTVVDAAHASKAMAFLPRLLAPGVKLPTPQSYAENAEWFTVPLWVTLDETTLKFTE